MRERAAGLSSEELYFSADVEADGPIPGPFSMLSFGLCLAGRFDGERFVRLDPEQASFYRELRPISDRFEPDALAVSGLDRDALTETGADPVVAMSEAHAWVLDRARTARPVLVAYPLGFDWMFLYWYFVRFCPDGSPFGFSSCLDVKTLYAAKARVPVGEATRSRMPEPLLPQREHTHHALADALAQAELFANLFEWRPSPS